MSLAARIAPQIDRLVLSVNTRTSAEFGEAIHEASRDAGLDGPGLLKHFADWMLADGVPPSVAARRLPYLPERAFAEWVEHLIDRRLLREEPGGLVAVGELVGLARLVQEGRRSVATRIWGDDEQSVAGVRSLIESVIGQAPDDYVVAASHRRVPLPGDAFLSLHQRLTTMRYLRAHAHVLAWRAAGLTADQIVALTRLRDGEATGGLTSLRERGLAASDSLTSSGARTRQEVEDETNRLCDGLLTVLEPGEGRRLAETLELLPGSKA